jgi:hypothetical protein
MLEHMGDNGQQARPRVAPNYGDRGLLELKARARSGATLPVDRDGEEHTLLGRHRPPLPSYTGLVEQAEEGKIGIACSGGGIRSAAFSLGAHCSWAIGLAKLLALGDLV